MSLGFYPHEGLDISCLQHFLSRIWFHRLDCNQGLKRSRWPTRQGFGEQIVQLRVSLFLILVFVIQHSWQIQTSKRTKLVSWVGQSRRLPHHLVLAFPDPHGHGHVHHAKGSSSDLWGENLRMVEVSQLKNRIPPACQGEVAPKETQMFGRKVTSKSANW